MDKDPVRLPEWLRAPHVLVYRSQDDADLEAETDYLIAHCLDCDVVGTGGTWIEALASLVGLMETTVLWAVDHGLSDFGRVSDGHLWRLFVDATSVSWAIPFRIGLVGGYGFRDN